MSPTIRFEVRALINGEGWVIVDTAWEFPMIGPYPKSSAGRKQAEARAAVFEADPAVLERAAGVLDEAVG